MTTFDGRSKPYDMIHNILRCTRQPIRISHLMRKTRSNHTILMKYVTYLEEEGVLCSHYENCHPPARWIEQTERGRHITTLYATLQKELNLW